MRCILGRGLSPSLSSSLLPLSASPQPLALRHTLCVFKRTFCLRAGRFAWRAFQYAHGHRGCADQARLLAARGEGRGGQGREPCPQRTLDGRRSPPCYLLLSSLYSFPLCQVFPSPATLLCLLRLHDVSALMCRAFDSLPGHHSLPPPSPDGRKINTPNTRKFGTWEATRTDFRTDSDEKTVQNVNEY